MLYQIKVSYFHFVNLFSLLKYSRICIDGQPDGDDGDLPVNFDFGPPTASVESQPGEDQTETDPPEITDAMVKQVYAIGAEPSQLIFKTIEVPAFDNTDAPKAGNNAISQKNHDNFLELINVQLKKFSNALNMIYFTLMVLKRWPESKEFEREKRARFNGILARIMRSRGFIKRVCKTSAAYGVFYNFAKTISIKCRKQTNYTVDLQAEYEELNSILEVIEAVALRLCSFVRANLLEDFTIDHERNNDFLEKMDQVARNLKLQEKHFLKGQTDDFNANVEQYAIKVIQIVDVVCPADSGIRPK